jgi:hypothetical protein
MRTGQPPVTHSNVTWSPTRGVAELADESALRQPERTCSRHRPRNVVTANVPPPSSATPPSTMARNARPSSACTTTSPATRPHCWPRVTTGRSKATHQAVCSLARSVDLNSQQCLISGPARPATSPTYDAAHETRGQRTPTSITSICGSLGGRDATPLRQGSRFRPAARRVREPMPARIEGATLRGSTSRHNSTVT